MITVSFVQAELLLALLWLAVRALCFFRTKHADFRREALLLLMYVNLAVLLRFTFFPMQRINGEVQPLLFDLAGVLPFRLNPVPFVNLFDYSSRKDLLLNVIGNTAMFIPSGIVLPVLFSRLRSFRRTAAAGAGLSLCIELMQLPFSTRTTDIDDLLLNTAGVMLGYGLYALCRKKQTDIR